MAQPDLEPTATPDKRNGMTHALSNGIDVKHFTKEEVKQLVIVFNLALIFIFRMIQKAKPSLLDKYGVGTKLYPDVSNGVICLTSSGYISSAPAKLKWSSSE